MAEVGDVLDELNVRISTLEAALAAAESENSALRPALASAEVENANLRAQVEAAQREPDARGRIERAKCRRLARLRVSHVRVGDRRIRCRGESS